MNEAHYNYLRRKFCGIENNLGFHSLCFHLDMIDWAENSLSRIEDYANAHGLKYKIIPPQPPTPMIDWSAIIKSMSALKGIIHGYFPEIVIEDEQIPMAFSQRWTVKSTISAYKTLIEYLQKNTPALEAYERVISEITDNKDIAKSHIRNLEAKLVSSKIYDYPDRPKDTFSKIMFPELKYHTFRDALKKYMRIAS